MSFLCSIALLLVMLRLDVSFLLREPDYAVGKDGDMWVVQKPRVGELQPLTISRHRDRSAAEFRKRSLPRLRLSGLFVRFDPATNERRLIADWAAQEDARDVDRDVREIVNKFGSAEVQALFQSTPIYMARLAGAAGHTAEESTDHGRFVIYLDPFRATGRLHAAATLVHELTHVERYRSRGFHANRAAAVLPREDFVLVGLADEFVAYQAEARLVQSFLNGQAGEEVRRAAREAIGEPELNWPVAVGVMLGFEGPSDQERRVAEIRRQVVLDLKRTAASYWESRHSDSINPILRQTIQNWYKHSHEWKEISAKRREWRKAESRLRGSGTLLQ
jgi:hypothetical protein